MTYCVQADIEKLVPIQELAELTTESGTTPDGNIITECIVKADGEIDAYCKKCYAVPFSPVPGIVKAMSVDIAIYHLYSRRSAVPDIRKYRYENAIKFLTAVAHGELLIPGPTPSETGGGTLQLSSAERVFSRDLLSDF